MMLEQIELDFTQPTPQADFSPQPAAQDSQGARADTFPVGCPVFLRGAPYGQPGRVLKVSRDKATVWWTDLNYLGHHACNSLMPADVPKEGMS
jgi:hypothetical protein